MRLRPHPHSAWVNDYPFFLKVLVVFAGLAETAAVIGSFLTDPLWLKVMVCLLASSYLLVVALIVYRPVPRHRHR